MKIVLASASERRQELLSRLVEEFEVIISNFDENKVVFKGNVKEYVENIALGKAIDVQTWRRNYNSSRYNRNFR